MANPLVARLRNLEASAAADVMTAMGLERQVLCPTLAPIGPRSRIAGPALCAMGTDRDGEPGLPNTDLDDLVYPGAIVVIDTDNCQKGAIIGGNMVTSMVGRGASGFLLDGGVRDTVELSRAPVPVYCAYASPINAHRFWRYTAFDVPVTLPGIWGRVQIAPGDYILGDEDGVCVLPKDHAEQIVRDAEIHMETEARIGARIEAGDDRKAATKVSKRLEHVVPLTEAARIPDD